MIMRNSQGKGGGINPAIKRHLELQIKTLQNAHRRDVNKLRQLLQVKEREKQQETIHTEDRQTDTQRLVTEIEMLKVVLYLVERYIRNVKVSFSRWVLVKNQQINNKAIKDAYGGEETNK